MDNSTSIKIPRKYDKMLSEVYHDSDGYWAYSKDGYRFYLSDCHTAHEDTQTDLLKVIRSLEPCDCKECKMALAAAEKSKTKLTGIPSKSLI